MTTVIIHGKASEKKRGLVERRLSRLEKLEKDGLDVYFTKYSGHATELSNQTWRKGSRRFVSMGGDGTNFEILNGFMREALSSGEKPELASLPLGTGNSFVRDFAPNANPNDLKSLEESAFSALERRETKPCDVIELQHEAGAFYFINLLSLGFVADVAFLRNRWFKHLGVLGYVLAVVIETVRLQETELSLTSDGKQLGGHLTFLSINNSKYTGGAMKIAPMADLSDGCADLIFVKPLSRCDLLKTFPKIFSGAHMLHPKVSHFAAKTIQFHLEREIPIMVDGETMKIKPKSLYVHPSVLRV